LHLALSEEGAKGPEGKSSWQKMLGPGIPKKAVKSFSARNKRDP